MSTKNDTLHGGRNVDVERYGAKPGEIIQENWFVKQLRVKDYPAAFRISDNEIALVAMAAAKSVELVGDLVPESYERIHTAMREVNAGGFFTYRERQLERANGSLRDMPPELVDKLIKLNSPMPSPGAPRQPVSR